MAKITRIKATDSPRDDKPADKIDEPSITRAKVSVEDKKSQKAARKAQKDIKKAEKQKKNSEGKKVFVLFRPFVALGRYLRGSWQEIRQVRWPNRKATWKMVLAVLIYTALFVLIISLLDMFFTWLFSLIIK
ncbi:preprotein translocase subunit SecE [Candidatus Saccharibacteria bacterium]|nr:preprotein translocase subunit SecE [Candidatus Saccharibacteria bacterium]